MNLSFDKTWNYKWQRFDAQISTLLKSRHSLWVYESSCAFVWKFFTPITIEVQKKSRIKHGQRSHLGNKKYDANDSLKCLV